jgi:GTP diphosphokinase / guanosine-3',5'-bis(diphosphate) 3'-diphosphatase
MRNLLAKFPKLRAQAHSSTDVSLAIEHVCSLYGNKLRLSGRFVVEHAMQTAEFLTNFTSESTYLVAALYHDILEDTDLSPSDLKWISGHDGERITELVSALTKRKDIEDWQARSVEYTNRLYQNISKGDYIIGIIKLLDRLENLTDLFAHTPKKRELIAHQTGSFFIPLAYEMKLPSVAVNLAILSNYHLYQD